MLQVDLTYPILGPIKGAMRNRLETTARCLGGNRSAIVPAPTASAALPVLPAKKRHTINDPKLLEKPEPSVKSINIGADARYIIFRPCCSDSGALTMGPKPRPKVKTARPTSAAVREIEKSFMISGTPGVYTDVPKVLNVVRVSVRVESFGKLTLRNRRGLAPWHDRRAMLDSNFAGYKGHAHRSNRSEKEYLALLDSSRLVQDHQELLVLLLVIVGLGSFLLQRQAWLPFP